MLLEFILGALFGICLTAWYYRRKIGKAVSVILDNLLEVEKDEKMEE